MNFSELEKLMSSRGVTTLAEIARTLNTTPQAVSNWKSRNQVPYRIAVKLSQLPPAGNPQTSDDPPIYSSPIAHYSSPIIYEKDTISLSDILLTIAEQLKVIVLTTFISVFLTFTYVQFIKQPLYVSWATVLLPESKMSNLGGLAGLASQFGVNVPMEATADLSSPSLYPELLRSRTFAEKILDKEFYLDEYGKKLTLLAILTQGDKPPKFERDSLITEAVKLLNEKYLAFDQDPQSTFSIIKVTAPEPRFAKNLA
ncbi:MAG: Wzz/FepE/Etk N-terminal domain-containing protein, partial [Candidatus Marinimicrobia bacterium]|nr:Wzz/FepE/Etk N-terminal domain-containing protein [Candidatus Neomarinimicrobiota bacterium]